MTRIADEWLSTTEPGLSADSFSFKASSLLFEARRRGRGGLRRLAGGSVLPAPRRTPSQRFARADARDFAVPPCSCYWTNIPVGSNCRENTSPRQPPPMRSLRVPPLPEPEISRLGRPSRTSAPRPTRPNGHSPNSRVEHMLSVRLRRTSALRGYPDRCRCPGHPTDARSVGTRADARSAHPSRRSLSGHPSRRPLSGASEPTAALRASDPTPALSRAPRAERRRWRPGWGTFFRQLRNPGACFRKQGSSGTCA